MKKLLYIITLTASFAATAQSVGINTDGSTPDASAVLDLKANGAKGLILPRLTTSQRDAHIILPTPGMVIYNTTTNALEVAISGSLWADVINGTTSAAASSPTSTSIGGVGIGTSSPDANAALDITSATKGVLLPKSATDPTGVVGMIYYNTAAHEVRLYNGSWVILTN
jgi:trimeric autotransporter adhesin